MVRDEWHGFDVKSDLVKVKQDSKTLRENVFIVIITTSMLILLITAVLLSTGVIKP